MIFIDANVYLEFFKSSKPEMKKLLPVLDELKENIFVTQQLVNEVSRNKLNVALANFNEYAKKCVGPGIRLPEHLDISGETLVKDWNKKEAEVRESVKSLSADLNKIIEHVADNIINKKDEVSQGLEAIFTRALVPEGKQVQAARWRRESGAPPGKPDNPLGDQLTWEQLLDAHDGKTALWVVTNDGDFTEKYKDKIYLNPVLNDEIQAKSGQNIDIYCFERLTDALEHYQSMVKEKLKTLPPPEEMESIKKSEITQTRPEVDQHFQPTRCFKCGSESFTSGVARPSQYGGWTYQWQCCSCGSITDTGEPYDD
ncbi:hypothetical protein F6V30_07965 [Oryzomonas sagensis]|uniref:DUF4935 domain-containing protein n=1 Tax=Oryzomonas sagensis TaxID=2603857 RepID=A0ABQ6TNW1_9BACT|nr:PIN domain-containing protein [Oryzomonas sagensis]KAB0670090.1 hypothetical protein F6V30_07965 [Oryzomonas sagensis]